MRKTLLFLVTASLFFVCNSAEAFRDLCILGENNGPSSFVEGNSWNAVVTDTSIYVPDMTVRIKDLNDTSYNLTVTWEKKHNIIQKKHYATDKKGRLKKGKDGNFIVTSVETVKSDKFKWEPTKIIKNGVIVANDNKYFYDKLFAKLTGYNADGKYDISNFLGVKEKIAEYKDMTPKYDGYGNISYYSSKKHELSVFTIFSKINKKLIVSVYGLWNNYYPHINEYSLGDSLLNKYQFMKNDSGVWKGQPYDPEPRYNMGNSWRDLTGVGYGLTAENAQALSSELDKAKAGLGL